jgi:hypothetical protein
MVQNRHPSWVVNDMWSMILERWLHGLENISVFTTRSMITKDKISSEINGTDLFGTACLTVGHLGFINSQVRGQS